MNFLNTLRGKALIISGPQGCGKTSLAVDVAQAAGLSRSEYRLESANSISHPFGLEGALRTNPTVITGGKVRAGLCRTLEGGGQVTVRHTR